MAIIGYNSSSPFGSKMARVVQDVKEAQQLLSRCIDTANDMTNGGSTPANLEGSAQFGVATGQGLNFYNALASLNSALFAAPASRTPLQASIDLDQG
jgi:hypothetical protein